VDLAPKYVTEILSGPGGGAAPPVLIGGVVKGAGGDRDGAPSGPGVSVMAASLPGVKITPFHCSSTSLPELSADDWGRLARPAAGASAARAGFLMADPWLRDVEALVGRLHSAVPGVKLLGVSPPFPSKR